MFEEVCRPVIFEHDDEHIPYSCKGSSVLLANSKHYYWATAAHLIKNMGGTPENIRIFPSDHSRQSLPFNRSFRITKQDFEDYTDLLILRVDLETLNCSGDAPLIAQDLDHGLSPAEALTTGASLLVIGYPAGSNWIDYDEFEIRYKRERLSAQYIGPGIDDCSYQLQFSDSVKLNNYDGLSGSPVFHLKEDTYKGEPVLLALFAGLLLRAGGPSRLGHFISCTVLARLVEKAETDFT